MLTEPLFWFAIAASLAPFVILRRITGRPTLEDAASTILILFLGVLDAFSPRR